MAVIDAKDYLKGGEAEGVVISDDETGEIAGALSTFKNNQDQQEIVLVGSHGTYDGEGNLIKDVGARVAGSFVLLDAQNISMGLLNPSSGDTLVVTGLTGDGEAIIGLQPPSPDAYFIEATPSVFAGQIASGTGTDPWVDIGLNLTLTQALAENNYNIYLKAYIEETGSETGSVDFGIGINGAEPVNFDRVVITDDYSASVSLNALGETALIGTETLSVWLRGTGNGNNYNLNVNGAISSATFKLQEINAQVNVNNALSRGASLRLNKNLIVIGNQDPKTSQLNLLFTPNGTEDLDVYVTDPTDGDAWSCFYDYSIDKWFTVKLTEAT